MHHSRPPTQHLLAARGVVSLRSRSLAHPPRRVALEVAAQSFPVLPALSQHHRALRLTRLRCSMHHSRHLAHHLLAARGVISLRSRCLAQPPRRVALEVAARSFPVLPALSQHHRALRLTRLRCSMHHLSSSDASFDRRPRRCLLVFSLSCAASSSRRARSRRTIISYSTCSVSASPRASFDETEMLRRCGLRVWLLSGGRQETQRDS